MRSFSPAASQRALLRPKAFDDILSGPGREQILRVPAGVPFGDMAKAERNIVLHIIDQFLGAMESSITESEWQRLREAGLSEIHFAWAGEIEPRQPHYYRLHGPLVIEYDDRRTVPISTPFRLARSDPRSRGGAARILSAAFADERRARIEQ